MCQKLFNIALGLVVLQYLIYYIAVAIAHIRLARCQVCELPKECICVGNISWNQF